jgi:predicted DNA binding CopG/RHH family protein
MAQNTPKTNLNVRISMELVEQLKKIAVKRDLSISQLIRSLVRERILKEKGL